MRVITTEKIRDTVRELSIRANLFLRQDVLKALKLVYKNERNIRAKRILDAIIKNASVARSRNIAICQDTGMPIVFVEVGQDVRISGDLKRAINKGVESGYKIGSLRNSIVSDPIKRGSPGYSPVVIHTEIVKGDKIKFIVLPKGFGCENKSQLKMFNPTAELSEVMKFIVDSVRKAGADACPPYIVGVGIGGTADYATLLAKKALLGRIVPSPSSPGSLEYMLLKEINKLNIGPMGLGGKTTALAVNIEKYPTHIAGLPVAVNISCHALRMAKAIL